ncbi:MULTISPECIES: ABC transporter permease [Kineococcus]|uniref:ABC transporter permease n=1 Tax=unclassified Kineococcus TaxID=2621656 RepID=UPI001F5826F4|nr:ABC transporter permease [Kineococcus sp. TRM81007]MCI2238310.1 ABC transporter permease [Kineococcus sp. TRM81007]MCI3924018.1 ABC transporter permease [Paenibacillus sp. TRM 82003]
MSAVGVVLADSSVIAKRNMLKITRIPDLLVGTLISPIMFILLFGYVFGGAIDVPNYREFIVPGIFAQTVIFGATITGAGIADDMQKGIIERFRSLPMAQSAVLVGRTASDVVLNVIVTVIMSLTGLVIGWRIRTSFLDAVVGFALLLLFAYALSWVMGLLGLLIRTPEAFNNLTFLTIFPLTFITNAFVPLETFPGPLQTIAQWNPVSTLVQAARERFGNVPPGTELGTWSLQNSELYTLLWIVVILAVFVPLATRQYRRAAAR